MCGITGVLSFAKQIEEMDPCIRKMTDTLTHRGPDAAGYWQKGNISLGHRRLAVIDLEGGVQPMVRTVHGETYTLTYNGELYNTQQLKDELIDLGYQFETTSDTEVLLYAFIAWREQAVQKLNGIFAFAVWDEARQMLYGCRDRLGVKPFYYAQVKGQLLFASEIKALLAHHDVRRDVSLEGLASLLSLGPSSEPHKTPFSTIEQLPPAHHFIATKGTFTLQCYWQTETKPHLDNEQQTAEHVRYLLTDAIERQLVSDVPLCTLLSGGIDSSIITAVAANAYKARGEKLCTYSVDYENVSFQQNGFQTTRDQHWIQLMSRFSDTEHTEVVVATDQLAGTLLQAMRLKDMPSMVDIDSSLLLFAEKIKEKFTVALSGECADELFGGYRWFYGDFEQFPWIRSLHAREALLNDAWRKKLNLQNYTKEVFQSTIEKMPLFHKDSVENKRQQLFLLNRHYFMQTLLQRKDKMTMGASLEVRVPFADHRLVEYVWNIPWEMKTTGNLEKGILRKAVEGLVPNEVLYRKKNPYPKTYDVRYTEIVSFMMKQCLEDPHSILHELFLKEQLQQLLEGRGETFHEPWFGQLMAGPQLIAYLVQLHHWAKEYEINIIA